MHAARTRPPLTGPPRIAGVSHVSPELDENLRESEQVGIDVVVDKGRSAACCSCGSRRGLIGDRPADVLVGQAVLLRDLGDGLP